MTVGKAYFVKELGDSLGLKCLYRLELKPVKAPGEGVLDDEDSFHESLPDFVVLSSVRCWWKPGPASEEVETLILAADGEGNHDMSDLPGSNVIDQELGDFEAYHKETLRRAGYELVRPK